MKPLRSKRGYQVGDLLPLGLAFVVLAIALSFGSDILQDIRWSQCTENTTTHLCVSGTDTAASNVSGQGLTALQTYADWMPTVALVCIAAIIVGIIIVYLARRFS